MKQSQLSILGALLMTSAFVPLPLLAQDMAKGTGLSLSDLTNIQITSVSKKAETASEAAASIFVITQDDVRRSGATSIPEVLRMVPGLQVAKSGTGQWAVTSRGFNDQFSNKLLVIIDGRTVYTPLFSGVYWDAQDTLLADIDRIEIIRGPGATLYGANAVNGVINIFTKSAKETQGRLVTAAAGNNERGSDAGESIRDWFLSRRKERFSWGLPLEKMEIFLNLSGFRLNQHLRYADLQKDIRTPAERAMLDSKNGEHLYIAQSTPS